MKDLTQSEIPKYRKKSKKKKFQLVWTYKGEIPKLDNIQRLFFFPRAKKFNSRKAAEDYIQNWKDGRGTDSKFHPPERWNVHIREL